MTNFICVFIGCGLGGICRYSLSAYLLKGASAHFPWATFAANAMGCLLIGLFLGYLHSRPSQTLAALAVTGFCGGFTTFSTFANETLMLVRQGNVPLAISYAALSLVAGFCLVALGYFLSRS